MSESELSLKMVSNKGIGPCLSSLGISHVTRSLSFYNKHYFYSVFIVAL